MLLLKRNNLKPLFSRAFSSSNTLIYAKLCQNGQGNKFKFTNPSNVIYDVNYSTFWNDFSHYSIYGTGPAAPEAPPIDYSAVDTDQSMF